MLIWDNYSGEDRWLCTLLLQQGYRVDYAAASDAFTYAPESFNEYFNQRRRWTPSTIANILDLLQDGRNTVASNNNISWLYIVYQGFILLSISSLMYAKIFQLSIYTSGGNFVMRHYQHFHVCKIEIYWKCCTRSSLRHLLFYGEI